MQLAKPTMPPSMLIPLLLMLVGFTVMFAALLLVRLRAEVLNRERTAAWIRDALSGNGAGQGGVGGDRAGQQVDPSSVLRRPSVQARSE